MRSLDSHYLFDFLLSNRSSMSSYLTFLRFISRMSDQSLDQTSCMQFSRYNLWFILFNKPMGLSGFLLLYSCLNIGVNHLNPMGLSGLEPPTSRLSGVRSNQLSYKPIFNFYHSEVSFWMEMMRFELTTPCLQGRCSPNWATPPFDLASTCSPTPSPVQYHRPLRS